MKKSKKLSDREKARRLLNKIYVDLAHMEYNLTGGDSTTLHNFRIAMKLLKLALHTPSEHGERPS